MRTLILFRHGKAEPHDARPDHERRLDKRGRADAPRMGERLLEAGLRPDLVLCSTSVRTQETWRLAARTFDPAPPVSEEARIYEADAGDLLEVVQGADPNAKSLLLVGHNPGFEDLVTLLVNRSGVSRWLDSGRTMPTSGVAVLQADLLGWRDVRPGGMNFVRVMRPKDENG
jgi:phosphohistidine phosphatase